jgi:hypothetical protein
VILLFNESHCCLSTTADGAGLPLQESAWGISLEKLGTIIINSCNKKSDTVGACHWLALLSLIAFSEVNGKVTDSLCNLFNGHRFCVIEAMILSFNTSVINQDASISDNSTHSAATMSVNL